MLAELYVIKGREAGKALELTPGSSVSFGRALSNEVRIRDAQVSRVHCRIECTEGLLRLKDSSGNGTYVNDDRMPAGSELALKDGDRVRLGSTEIRVLIESPVELTEREETLTRSQESRRSPSALAVEAADEVATLTPLELPDEESGEDEALEATEATPARAKASMKLPPPPSSLNDPGRSQPRARARRPDFPDPNDRTSPAGEPVASPEHSLREVIPGYRIEAKLGGGGRRGTVVYRALQLSLDRPVALKVLLPAGAGRERDLGRFLREAAAVARLQHPNIVTIHDSGRAGERRYLVMELLTGGSVADRLEDGPLPAADAVGLGIEVARALAYAHTRGIVHRTIRPGNVLKDASGSWKLVDFGLARDEVRGGSGETTFLDAPVETIIYLAPEQLEHGPGDARSDVYSLGGLLYHAITGHPPVTGSSIAEVAGALHAGEVATARLEPVVSSAFATVVRRCLARDPGERYPDGQTVLHELLAAHAVTAAPPPVPGPAPGPATRARGTPRPARPT
jgi:serine/threonine protein kinase/pSer/pThr/pTyr-binding forkhead associated (FHA) protein